MQTVPKEEKLKNPKSKEKPEIKTPEAFGTLASTSTANIKDRPTPS